MKKLCTVSFFLIGFISFFSSCKKINESTTLGGDLIPAVDNINTFDTSLTVISDNRLLADSNRISFYDDVAIGRLNDPVFGQTDAAAYFNVGRLIYPGFPFVRRDSITIDSVVLSLSYQGAYGDTNNALTYRVFELAQTPDFQDTVLYRYNHPDFPTTAELGSKTFIPKDLDDSVRIIRPNDTTKVANRLRITLDPQLGRRFVDIDTSGFTTDSALKSKFKGFAVKADNGNALAYFNLSDANTRLIVYYKAPVQGKDTSLTAELFHAPIVPSSPSVKANFRNGQANIIRRTPAGDYANYLANATASDDKVFIQSGPNGSFAHLFIPALSNFQNAVIHRAELVMTRLDAPGNITFTPPVRLWLERKRSADSVLSFPIDMFDGQGNIDFATFGGSLKSNTYSFNISRYVQGVVTRRDRNDTLRLHAPFITNLFFPNSQNRSVAVQILDKPAKGRVVVTGGAFADPRNRMRLRIIYSKI